MTQVSERFDDLGADGALCKLGIMGGTFDPIHIGHLRIAEEVRLKLGLDAVLFMPAGAPVFKRGQKLASAADRLAMCRLAIAGNPHFDVSTIELDREGDTFTADTLEQMRAHYPENVQFYFILGSDAALSLEKWRRSADVARLADIAIAYRPGYPMDDEARSLIEELPGFRFHWVDVSALDISSSAIRARCAAGESIRYLVDRDVVAYIAEKRLYCEEKPLPEGLQDALSEEFFEARKAELEGRVSAKRFTHIMGVVETCEQLARTYGVDVPTARLAGLLHDWDKGYDNDGIRARVREVGLEDVLDPWVVQNMPQILHGLTAAAALRQEFPQIPPEVLQAINRHTTGAENMSDLDKVLYVADGIEPNRRFDNLKALRDLVGAVPLDELFLTIHEYWLHKLFERKQGLYPDTIRIWNSYLPELTALKKKQANKGESSGYRTER